MASMVFSVSLIAQRYASLSWEDQKHGGHILESINAIQYVKWSLSLIWDVLCLFFHVWQGLSNNPAFHWRSTWKDVARGPLGNPLCCIIYKKSHGKVTRTVTRGHLTFDSRRTNKLINTVYLLFIMFLHSFICQLHKAQGCFHCSALPSLPEPGRASAGGEPWPAHRAAPRAPSR